MTTSELRSEPDRPVNTVIPFGNTSVLMLEAKARLRFKGGKLQQLWCGVTDAGPVYRWSDIPNVDENSSDSKL